MDLREFRFSLQFAQKASLAKSFAQCRPGEKALSLFMALMALSEDQCVFGPRSDVRSRSRCLPSSLVLAVWVLADWLDLD